MLSQLTYDTEFAVNLFQQVAVDNVSLVLSPLSISLALSLIHLGAKGNSEEQLRKALANGANCSGVTSWYSHAHQKIASDNELRTLEIANKLYIDKKFKVLPEYLKDAKKHFGAEPENVNFADAKGSAKIVNDFVNKNTLGNIPSVLQPADINESTVMSIVTSPYFQADWHSTFDQTFEADFHRSGSDKRTVIFLKNIRKFSHINFGTETVLRIPYKQPDHSLIIVLPNTRFGLHNLVKKLTAEQVHKWLSIRNIKPVAISIPKFKIESSFSLPEQLKKIGIVDMFDENKANLHGISKDHLSVSEVIHKAKIEITREGTGAAAAVASANSDKVSAVKYGNLTEFIADHPFLFIVEKNGHPIFMGQYY